MCNEERKEYFEISDKFIELPILYGLIQCTSWCLMYVGVLMYYEVNKLIMCENGGWSVCVLFFIALCKPAHTKNRYRISNQSLKVFIQDSFSNRY